MHKLALGANFTTFQWGKPQHLSRQNRNTPQPDDPRLANKSSFDFRIENHFSDCTHFHMQLAQDPSHLPLSFSSLKYIYGPIRQCRAKKVKNTQSNHLFLILNEFNIIFLFRANHMIIKSI